MAKIVSNRLLAISILVVCFYWLTASLVPNPYLTVANNTLLFVASAFGLYRYREKTFDILFEGERVHDTDKGYGGYLAVYGIFLVFLGSFYGAVYSSVWIYMGQPTEWIGTSFSQFGRFLTIGGFVCMAFSPDITKEGFILPDKMWAIIVAMLLLFGLGIWIGTRVESREISGFPSCPRGAVIGTGNKTYHTAESRYRMLVVPRKCFTSEGEAQKAGYVGVR